MTSILKVDNIQKANGSTPTASDLGINTTGSVLQVKYFQLTTSQTETYPTANTDKAITNFVVNITPKSTSSIMKIEANLMYESANASWDAMWFFYRDTTKLGNTQSSPGSRQIGIAPGLISYYSADNASTPEFATLTYFDDPQTTSAINYKLAVTTNTASNFFINRNVNDTDNSSYDRGVSFISVTEIGG